MWGLVGDELEMTFLRRFALGIQESSHPYGLVGDPLRETLASPNRSVIHRSATTTHDRGTGPRIQAR